MCGTQDTVETTKWQREPPNSPGEWLWLHQFTCGCVAFSGIAWVPEPEMEPDGLVDLPNGLKLSWEGSNRLNLPLEAVTAWRKISLPPQEWCDR